ncbi:G kinase-anchoring protein 1-like [Physella acuta]|uniref:G kinase-anchoring protein 1-like n=1 Tax=Physella acuta TaxID=109671 RepID=UPI0027DBD317|nr:G kinase-anchoring protein 1-like [Physella acuta]
MANRQGISVSTSRFAVLKIEDDEDDERKPPTKASSHQNASSSSAAKKKNKKKRDNKESEQLKSLAFGKTSGKLPRNGTGDGGNEKKAWDQWKEHDKELVEEKFKDDLAAALLQSRIEAEQKQQEALKQKQRIEAGLEAPTTKEGRKKKKQKEKPQAMSLEQFKQLPPEKTIGSDSEDEVNGRPQTPPVQTRVPLPLQDSKFFNSVEDDAEHILRQEKIQEEYRKQYASDNVIVAKLKNDLEKKENQLTEAQKQIENMEAELKQVKKRNKQLCVILAQGEMKDKAQVLLQVDELTAVKDELTDQVTSLTAELEKEKSKNHSMKAELDKLKGNKHGK